MKALLFFFFPSQKCYSLCLPCSRLETEIFGARQVPFSLIYNHYPKIIFRDLCGRSFLWNLGRFF